MLLKAADLVKASVITETENTVLENIADVIYNPQQQRIVALVSKSTPAKIILYKHIVKIGKGLVVIASKDVILNAHDIQETHPFSGDYLVKTKVFTANGMLLGIVIDLYFDAQTGEVKTFIIASLDPKTNKISLQQLPLSQVKQMKKESIWIPNKKTLKQPRKSKKLHTKG